MDKIKLFFLTIIFLLPTTEVFAENLPTITNYSSVFIAGTAKGKLEIAIRSFSQASKDYYLVVDPQNLTTAILPVADFQKNTQSLMNNTTAVALSKTLYFRALEEYTSSPYPLANDGLRHADHAVKGYFLTIDMCPSTKPFEKNFFNELVHLADKYQQPIPVALAMSGLWIVHHGAEFNWLVAQQTAGKLQITWVNHSWHHAYKPQLTLNKNFLLMKGSNFVSEVLGMEKILLAHGQLPSVFFRFPGLISDGKLILELRSLGLIPLGTDAWLAKDETPKPGSIILVHGNSNEPEGIKKIMPILADPSFTWLPLAAALYYK